MFSLCLLIKGCVRYIFASLFCNSKRMDFWNKGKCCLFHFKRPFHYWIFKRSFHSSIFKRSFHSFHSVSLSLNQTLLTFWLYVRQTCMALILVVSLWFLPLILKNSITHLHGLAVYVREELSFARDLSLGNSTDSYLCLRLALLHSVFYFFFIYPSPSSALSTAFYSISSNIDGVLSINPSANLFVFGDFNMHDNLSWWTDRPGELKWSYSDG